VWFKLFTSAPVLNLVYFPLFHPNFSTIELTE
jgi:hypothetical protein